MIIPDSKTYTLDIPHLGITLRSIMGAAAAAAQDMTPYRRRWVLMYKGANIGAIQLARGE